MVVSNAEKAIESYKGRQAVKLNVPLVSMSFVDDCIQSGKLLDADPYIVSGNSRSQQLQAGKIEGWFFVINFKTIII